MTRPDDERITKEEGECWTARDLRPAAGTTTEEKYVVTKPISPSKDHRKEDRKEYKVSGTSTLHLAAPSVVCLRQQRAAQNELFRLAMRWC